VKQRQRQWRLLKNPINCHGPQKRAIQVTQFQLRQVCSLHLDGRSPAAVTIFLCLANRRQFHHGTAGTIETPFCSLRYLTGRAMTRSPTLEKNMGNKNMGNQDAKKNLDQGTSTNRQDEQQAQQARDRDNKQGQQGGPPGGENKHPGQDHGHKH
jgi:hypothetical protein